MADAGTVRTNIKASDLDDGVSGTLTFENDGNMIDTQYGEAVVFEVIARDWPDTEEGAKAELLTSSSRLLGALADTAGSMQGVTVTVERQGSGTNTQYTVTEE